MKKETSVNMNALALNKRTLQANYSLQRTEIYDYRNQVLNPTYFTATLV